MITLPAGDPSDRRGYCGGTDAAAIVCSRDRLPYYRSAWSVWAEQHHPELIAEPDEETRARWALGHHLEGYVLARLAEQEEIEVCAGGYVSHPAAPVLRAQLDGLGYDEGRLIGPGDAKVTEIPWDWRTWQRRPDGWRELDALPPGYQVQARWGLGLLREHCRAEALPLPAQSIYAGLDLTRARAVPDDAGARLDLATAPIMVRWIDHDEEIWRDLLDYVSRWWAHHIVEGHEPPDDEGDVCQRYRLHVQARGLGRREASPEEVELIEEWRAVAAAAKEATAERKRLAARILAGMDVPRLDVGGAYVQIQRMGRGMALRAHQFP